MAWNRNKKKEKSAEYNPADSSALMDVYKQLLQQDQAEANINKADNWTPTIMPLSNAPTQGFPLQLLGQLSYDNTPNTWAAPAYGQLVPLGKERERQGQANKSNFEKAKENFINSLPSNSNDPSHLEAKQAIIDSMDKYTQDLGNNLWSSNGNMVKDFVSDVLNNKGGKTFMQMKQQVAQKQEEIDEYAKNYDPDGGGLSPDDINYYLTPKEIPFTKDKNGNFIGGGYKYPPVFQNRNFSKELDDMTKDTKYFERAGLSANGQQLYKVNGILGKYLYEKEEYVTEDRIKEIAQDYLLNEGGHEYLQNKGQIDQFNNPMDVKTARQILLENSKVIEEDNKQNKKEGANPYKTLYNLSDEELAKKLEQGVGATLYTQQRTQSLLSGAITKNAYTKKTANILEDSVAIDAAKEANKPKSSEELQSDSVDAIAYSINWANPGAVIMDDPQKRFLMTTNLKNIQNDINKIDAGLKTVDKNSVQYFDNLKKRDDLEKQSNHIKQLLKLSDNAMANEFKNVNNAGLYTMFQLYRGQQNSNNITQGQFTRTINNTIEQLIKNPNLSDEQLTAMLVKNGINPIINLNNNTNKVVSPEKIYKQLYTDSTKFGAVLPSNSLNLLKGIKNTANSYIKKKAEGKLGSIEVPSAVLQIANRDSVKNTPALAGYESAMELVTKSFLTNPKRIQTYNITGGDAKNNTLLERDMLNAAGLADSDIDTLSTYFDYDPKKITIEPSLFQGYGSQAGQIVYRINIPLREKSTATGKKAKEENDKLSEIQQKLKQNSYSGYIVMNEPALDRSVANNVRAISLQDKYKEFTFPNETRDKLALVNANISGISAKVDKLYLNELDPSRSNPNPKLNYKDIILDDGNHIRISALPNPFDNDSYDKDYDIRFKQGNEFMYVGSLDGQTGYYSAEDLKKNPKIIKKTFNTPTDIKIFLSQYQTALDHSNFNANFNTGGGGSSVYDRIGQKESSNRDLGNHYPSGSGLSASGRYGITNTMVNSIAKWKGVNPETVRNSPTLQREGLEHFAKIEITPTIFNNLKTKFSKKIPNFNENDAVALWHYGGINTVNDIIAGRVSIDSVPSSGNPKHPNIESFVEYIKKIKNG